MKTKYVRRWKIGPPPKVEGVYIVQVKCYLFRIYRLVTATLKRLEHRQDRLIIEFDNRAYDVETEDMPKIILRHIGPFKFPATGKPRKKR